MKSVLPLIGSRGTETRTETKFHNGQCRDSTRVLRHNTVTKKYLPIAFFVNLRTR